MEVPNITRCLFAWPYNHIWELGGGGGVAVFGNCQKIGNQVIQCAVRTKDTTRVTSASDARYRTL